MKPRLRMPYKPLLWSGLALGTLCLMLACLRATVHVSREGGETTIQVNGLMIEINRDVGRDAILCIQDALRIEAEAKPIRVSAIKKPARVVRRVSGLDRRVDARMRERTALRFE